MGDMPMENAGPPDPHTSSVNIEPTSPKQSFNFPVFMIAISLIQVITIKYIPIKISFNSHDTYLLRV